MESENVEERETVEEKGQGTEVCIRCMRPIGPLEYYCSHCGEASGQLTNYLPFINIPSMASFWGRIWRQVWSRDVSIFGRIFRFIIVIWSAPIMLIGLFFMDKKEEEK